MAKKYDKDQLLADFKTGGFSLQALADKYSLSKSMVAKLTRGVHKSLEPIVTGVVDKIKEEVHGKSVQEVHAVTSEIMKRTKHIEFIHNASLKNVQVMMRKVDETTAHQEHKFVQEAINKAGEALGVIEKGGAVNISNTNAQQNNNPPDLVINISK